VSEPEAMDPAQPTGGMDAAADAAVMDAAADAEVAGSGVPGAPGSESAAGGGAMAGDRAVGGSVDVGGEPGRTEVLDTAGQDIGSPDDPSARDPLDVADASLLGLVDRLAAILERSDLLELEVQAGATALILRRPEALAPTVPLVPPSAVPRSGSSEGGHGTGLADRHREHEAEPAAGPERASVTAPLTGIWYSAPSPGSAPFVRVGGEVAVGQVIGLIEAMKLFNEIKSDLAGRVVRVAVESGQLVKAKQPLIEVEPL
jgi:acetyl-CoA carboxylase biotin carboxyl carrier protein